MSFDPAIHRLIADQRWFDDFRLGERFVLPSRTMSNAVFRAFQAASGDNHPVHYDIEYCRRRGMPDLLAHGFQTLVQTAPGAGLFPFMVEDALVGFLGNRAASCVRHSRRTRCIRGWKWMNSRPAAPPGGSACAARSITSAASWFWTGGNDTC